MKAFRHRPGRAPRELRSNSPRLSIATSVASALWTTSALAASPSPNTLPTNWSAISGGATFLQAGSTLNVNQTSARAIVNFGSFSVGSNASVDIHQPGSSSALLARVTGSDPSQIFGQIKANGSLWLINPAGIMVGEGARIDVGGFIASTLNVSNSDFLASRLTFTAGSKAAAVDNAGAIETAEGGSVYLVGTDVKNGGVISAPDGEVILAAGQTVQLVGTGTPGVSVSITGRPGDVTNLGKITSAAGRIGLAAGLVNNSGNLNASSVVKDGGRIFLRASQDLTTSANSTITADGVNGGNVVLKAQGSADIEGDVSALGSSGRGGYVETSGLGSLNVVAAPKVGRGGNWYIDPYDIDIVGSGSEMNITGSNAIVSTGPSATILASTIETQLNGGTDVTITTGTGDPVNDVQHGNITVSSPIAKTAGADATLTLNANNNIVINANITSTSGALNLNLNSNYQSNYPADDHTVQVANATLDLHGGALNVSESGGSNNGAISFGTNSILALNSAASQVSAATINVLSGGEIDVSGGDIIPAAALNNAGMINVTSGTLALNQPGTHSGTFNVAAGATLDMAQSQDYTPGTGFTGTGNVEWSGTAVINTNLIFGSGNPNLTLHNVILSSFTGNTLLTQGAVTVVDDHVTLGGSVRWNNAGALAIQGNGAVLIDSEGAYFDNEVPGVITTSGSASTALAGSGNGNVVNDGTIIKTGATAQSYSGIVSEPGSVISVNAGSLSLLNGSYDNTFNVAGGATLNLTDLALSGDASFTGSGTVGWNGTISITTPIDIAADAPTLNMGPSLLIQGSGDGLALSLTTRNAVNILRSTVAVAGLTWNNYGTVTLGGSTSGNLNMGSTAVFNNHGTLAFQSGSTLTTLGTDLHSDGIISGTGTLALGGTGTLYNDGTIAPGTSTAAGTVEVQGKCTQGAAGNLRIKVGGTSAGNFDVLNVDGTTTLGGTLTLSALNNYAFQKGDALQFLVSGGPASGSFSQVSSGNLATFAMDYTGGALATVTALPAPPVTPPVTPPSAPPPTTPPPTTPPATVTTTVQQATNQVTVAVTQTQSSGSVQLPMTAPNIAAINSNSADEGTTGGTSGTFGGSDDSSGSKGSTAPASAPKAAKPLPVCT